jgi:DNA polymerase I-like protein with 3'-5' exonuclease and polymerase domains
VATVPRGLGLQKYYLTSKPLSQLANLEKFLTPENIIHPTVRTSATRTSRCAHYNPNTGQLPAVRDSEEKTRWAEKYGREFRDHFLPDDDDMMVGSDQKSLELRCLADAFYQLAGDDSWLKMMRAGEDVHERNQKLFGVKNRTDAKRIIFAIVYGAGAAKVGEILIGEGEDERKKANVGRQALKKVYKTLPSLKKIKGILEEFARQNQYVILPNGRKLYCPVDYTALNTYLQGLGAEVSKYWIKNVCEEIEAKNIDARILLYVHDEIQLSCGKKDVKRLEKVLVEASEKVKGQLKTEMEFAADVLAGKTWKDTH